MDVHVDVHLYVYHLQIGADHIHVYLLRIGILSERNSSIFKLSSRASCKDN